jgi:quercetin dioxygenase-like cupin family protein
MSQDQPAPRAETSGTDTRGPRTVSAGLSVHRILDEVERLSAEPEWSEGDRDSLTLAKAPDVRLLLSVLRAGARIGDEEAHGSLAVQTLAGAIVVGRDDERVELRAGELAVLQEGAIWWIEAQEQSALLLTMAWPEERPRS